jgi:hypothetical protein
MCSDAPAPRDPIDLRAVLARIDRDLAENVKLLAEARKFNRERWIAPVTVAGAILAAIVARLPEILHAFGWAS